MTWDKNKFLPDQITKLSEIDAAHALKDAWKRIFNTYPSKNTLACIWSQTVLETGRYASMHCWNWGNIKSKSDDGHYWTAFRCSEVINGKEQFFDPPHPYCNFRAYKTATDGAEDYILFLTKDRYKESLSHLIKGNVMEYTIALKNAGYFTASLNLYMTAMTRLYNEFIKKYDAIEANTPGLEIIQNDLFSEDELKQIIGTISITGQELASDYFKDNKYEEIDDSKYDNYYKIEKKSFWDTIKNKLGFK